MTIVVALTASSLTAQQPGEPVSLPPDSTDEELDALTRGPLHEAFAEVTAEPEPGLMVEKVPPEPLDEIPPSHRPEGDDVVWIPGYWGWDEDRQDFIWISGVWRKVPPGRTWVPGYWQEVAGGQQWISGFWASSNTGEIEYLPTPPPSAESGPSGVAPSDNHCYVPGSWLYVDQAYRWRPGFWTPQHVDWTWIPHRYVWTPRGCIFRHGYWDYLPARRGVLFAPVRFRRPLRLLGHHRYTPSCVIDVGPSLLVHLFVRPRYCHYYFGDYYASRYRQHRIYPWVTAWQRHRHYDPLFAYYYYHRGRRDSVIRRVHGWHRHFDQHHEHRPAHRFVDQQRRRYEGNVSRVSSLGRSFQNEIQQSGRGHDFVRVKGHKLEQIRAQSEPLRVLRRERSLVESQVASRGSGGAALGEGSASRLKVPDLIAQYRRALQPQSSRAAAPNPNKQLEQRKKQLQQRLSSANSPATRSTSSPQRSSATELIQRQREGLNKQLEQRKKQQLQQRSSTSNAVSPPRVDRPTGTPRPSALDRLRSRIHQQRPQSAQPVRRAPATVPNKQVPQRSTNSLRTRTLSPRPQAPLSRTLRAPSRTEVRRAPGLSTTPRASTGTKPSFRAAPRPSVSSKVQRARISPRSGSAGVGTRRNARPSSGFGGAIRSRIQRSGSRDNKPGRK